MAPATRLLLPRSINGSLAERVQESGKPMKMQPLNAYHRRLVHNALQSMEGIATESEEGDGRYKRITIRRA